MSAESSAASMDDKEQKILAILNYLEQEKTTGQLKEEQCLDLAIQSLETAYGISSRQHSDMDQLALRDTMWDTMTDLTSQQKTDPTSSTPLLETSAEEKLEAESLKSKGNDLMNAEKFSEAVDMYTQAIEKDGNNAVYYCNRAAAYSKDKKYKTAIEDCQAAVRINPAYSKAYGRMGIAYSAVGNHDSAVACQRKALELDPDNQGYRNNLHLAEQTLREATAKGADKSSSASWRDIFNYISTPDFLIKATRIAQDPRRERILTDLKTKTSAISRVASVLEGAQLVLDHFGDQ